MAGLCDPWTPECTAAKTSTEPALSSNSARTGTAFRQPMSLRGCPEGGGVSPTPDHEDGQEAFWWALEDLNL